MIVNSTSLILNPPIRNMETRKKVEFGVSYGLGEAGYDIRIKQDIQFAPNVNMYHSISVEDEGTTTLSDGRFTLASTIEEFDMPIDLVGVVHDKSSWARRGLSVFNTIIEPGWKGFLTLELVYHGNDILRIPAGAGIAQVVFHQTAEHAQYNGKYQNQVNRPVEAIYEKG